MMRSTRTRFATATALGLALACLAGGAHAGGRASRTETGTYYAGGVQGVVGLTAAGQESLGAVRFAGGPERLVSVTVEDSTGLAIAGEVAQSLDSDTAPEVSYEFCGTTPKPVKVVPHQQVVVYLYAGTCDSAPSLPTHGRVVAEFSAKR